MKKLDIIINIDDVVRDTLSSVLDLYKGNINKQSFLKKEDIRSLDILKYMPELENKEQFYRNNSTEIYICSPLQRNAKEGLNKLAENHNIYLLSSQYRGTENKTIDFIHMHDLPYDNILFTRDINKVKGDVLIDDNLRHLHDFNGYKISINRPYNEKASNNYAMANDLLEANDIVKYFIDNK